jgi:hypothetical protein
MATKPNAPASNELTASELEKITGAGGLHFGMVSGPSGPPGPPVIMYRGRPIGH